MVDYYQILKISPQSSFDEVRKAFRREAKRCHPDLYHNINPEEKQKLQKQFIMLTKAYETLSDPAKRRSFDLQYQRYSTKKQFQEKPRSSNRTSSSAYRQPSSEPFTETTDDSLEDLLDDVEQLLGKFGLQFKDPLELLVNWASKVFQDFVTAWKEEDAQPFKESKRPGENKKRSIMDEIEAELKNLKQRASATKGKARTVRQTTKSSSSYEIEHELQELKKKYNRPS